MIYMKRIFILCLILFYTLPVFSADWIQVFDKDYIDRSSVKFKDSKVSFWVKSLNAGSWEFSKFYKDKLWYILHNLEIDCSKRTYKSKSFYVYNLKEECIDSQNFNYTNFDDIVPDTKIESYYMLFCR